MMRDYYAELQAKKVTGSPENQLPKPTIPPFGSNGSWFSKESQKNNAPDQFTDPVESHGVRNRRIDEYNAIDAYMEKLQRVRDDPTLARAFDDYCEERKSIMIVDGQLSEEEAEAAITDFDFLVNALLQE